MRTPLATLVVVAALAARAEETATLAQYMDAAVKNNPRRAVVASRTQLGELDVQRAKSALLPELRAGGSWSFNQNFAEFDPDGDGPAEVLPIIPRNQLDLAITARIPLFDGLARTRVQSLEANVKATTEDVRVTEDDLRLEVARAWYVAVAAQEVLTAAERTKAVAVENHAYLAKRAAAGSETGLAVKRAELEITNAEGVLIDARRNALIARRALATLSGLPEPSKLPVSQADLAPAPAEESLLADAERANPELTASRARIEALEITEGGAWQAWLPTVSAEATERLSNATGFTGNYSSFIAGVRVDWLAWDFGGRDSEIRRTRVALDAADAEYRRLRDAVRDQVHAAWLEVEASRAKLETARRGAAIAQAAANEMRTRFQAGTAPQIDVIQAERDALNAEVDRIRAEGTLAVARLALQRAAGQPIRP